MGVIQKELAKVEFKDQALEYLEIELNDGPIIHLQNKALRIEMSPEEFTQFASHVVNSANKMIEYKKITSYDD
jgi:hypothetical protein